MSTPDQIDLARASAFRVGPVTVEPALRQITATRSETLEPRVMQVLVVLAMANGGIVSRDDLVRQCWEGRIVGDDSINRIIARLRKLADEHGDGEFRIETITKVGYRLIGQVALVASSRPTNLAALAVDAPVVTAPADAAQPAELMLAVLAFDNLSNDPETGYFSDGVSEDILQAVARAGYIKVAGKSSSFIYRGVDKTPSAIAAQLGVSHILDGSVRRVGARIRVTTSLIDCASQIVLWSQRFDREVADVFALQDEIAASVAAALEAPLAPMGKAPRIDPAAYNLYLQARAIVGDPWHAPECIRLLEQAVTLAPQFAAAWASLATAISVDMRFRDRGIHCAALRPAAIAAAERAIGLDPAAAPAYVALSLAEPIAAFAARDALLQRALAAQPNDVESLKFAADLAQAVGRNRNCFDLVGRAHDIDPLNWLVANNYAATLADNGLIQASRNAFDAGRERWPDLHWFTSVPLGLAFMTGAWDEVDRLLALDIDWSQRVLAATRANATMMRNPTTDQLMLLVERAETKLATTGRTELTTIIMLQTAGLLDHAYDLIARASFDHVFDPVGAPLDRNLLISTLFGCVSTRLRRDPRFVGLCAKLGLVAYWFTDGRWPDCAEPAALPYDFRGEAAKYV